MELFYRVTSEGAADKLPVAIKEILFSSKGMKDRKRYPLALLLTATPKLICLSCNLQTNSSKPGRSGPTSLDRLTKPCLKSVEFSPSKIRWRPISAHANLGRQGLICKKRGKQIADRSLGTGRPAPGRPAPHPYIRVLAAPPPHLPC